MQDNVPSGYEIIVLQGKLNCNAGPNAVVAGANENSVYIHFNQSFGNVSISIYNAEGNLVYDTSKNEQKACQIGQKRIPLWRVERIAPTGLRHPDNPKTSKS